MEISWRIRDTQGARLMRLEGTLDSSTANQLDDPVAKAVADKVMWLIVELEAIDYVSSAGWGALIHHSKAFQAVGGGLILSGIPPHLRLSWKALALDGIVVACATTDDALKHVRTEKKS